jgi:hypothetical protein
MCAPNSPLVLVSQTCHRDLNMYLLALKSFTRFIPPRQVVILDDGSLTRSDKIVLRQHIATVEIRSVGSVINIGPCPKLNFWERILLVADLVRSDYVIQLDSDTLTLRNPTAVSRAIYDNRTFTQAGDDGERILPGTDIAKRMQPQLHASRHNHTQLAAEASLDHAVSRGIESYVRGCAGFTGFGKGSFSRQRVEQYTVVMRDAVGAFKWNERGSDQVMSNLIVANTPGAEVLPFEDYCYHRPELDLSARTFIHFLGTYRFNLGRYRRLGRRVVRELATSREYRTMPAQAIPIFVISLARSVTRREAIERHLSALGLSFECVDAVDGRTLAPETLATVTGPEKIPIGQVACALSHLSVYQRIVSREIPVACVLEDDGRLHPSAIGLLQKGCVTSDFDLCFLDCENRNHRGVVCFDPDSRTEIAPGISTYLLSDGPFSLHAYLISLAGAKKRSAEIVPVREAIDRYDFGSHRLNFRAVLHPRLAFLSVLSRASLALDSTRSAEISWYRLRGLPGYYPIRDFVKGTRARRWHELRAKQAAGQLSSTRQWRPLSGGARILPE